MILRRQDRSLLECCVTLVLLEAAQEVVGKHRNAGQYHIYMRVGGDMPTSTTRGPLYCAASTLLTVALVMEDKANGSIQ